MQLTLVRHGQCEDGADGDLTPLGRQQARQTARHLADTGVTHLLCSPLLRALTTAQALVEVADIPTIEVWLDLREGFSYAHRALGRDDIQRRYPRAVLPPAIGPDGWDDGGDTYASFVARCQTLLTTIQGRFAPHDHVVVVTHGGVITYLLQAILGIPPAAPCWFDTAYCALTRVRLVPEGERWDWPLYPPMAAEILCVNDTSHLRTQSPGPATSSIG